MERRSPRATLTGRRVSRAGDIYGSDRGWIIDRGPGTMPECEARCSSFAVATLNSVA